MNLQRARRFLLENFIFYLVGILVVLGIKYYYSQAECDSLLWILAPTTRWVELLSGIPFTYVAGTGYVNHSLRLLIAPSCSGVSFMIITIAMLVFSFVHIVASPKAAVPPKDVTSTKAAAPSKDTNLLKAAALLKDVVPSKAAAPSNDIPAIVSVQRIGRGAGWIVACMAFSWLFTVLVNGLRIIVAICLPLYLERVGLVGGTLTSDRLHTIIGIVVYFTALLMLYRFVDYIVQRKIDLMRHSQNNEVGGTINNRVIPREQFPKALARKCIPPIFWYFLMTVGLPFLNRAYLKDGTKFMEFAILIVCCIMLVLLPYCILFLLHDQKSCKE